LLALLGLTEVQGLRINQQQATGLVSSANSTAAANSTGNATFANRSIAANATGNATLAAANGTKMNDNMNAEIDQETKAEMEAFDEQAEAEADAAYGSDEDSYTMLENQILADAALEEAEGPKAASCPPPPASVTKNDSKHSCTTEHCLHKNNKDSSDDECTCKPQPYTKENEDRIMSIQAKRKADAAAAKKNADDLRKKAEAAVVAAHNARLAALKAASEASDKASALAVKATKAAQKKINKEGKWKQKTSLIESEQKDLKVKRTTHEWEETVVAKHEMWATYRTIKKELSISSHNVH